MHGPDRGYGFHVSQWLVDLKCYTQTVQFNIPKSHLIPTTSLTWLAQIWDTFTATVALSHIDSGKVSSALIIVPQEWFRTADFDSSTSSITPWRSSSVYISRTRSPNFLPTSFTLPAKMMGKNGALGYSDSLGSSTPRYDTTDVSVTGWEYQWSMGHQGSDRWTPSACRIYICPKTLNCSLYTARRTFNQANINIGTATQFSRNTLPELRRFLSVTSPSPRIGVSIQTGQGQVCSHHSLSPSRRIQQGRFPLDTNVIINWT